MKEDRGKRPSEGSQNLEFKARVVCGSKFVAARFEASGFNPQEVRARLGIEADVAIYLETPGTA